ncbi:MAG: TIGR01210 family radical SAM protein [Nitrospirae bacterium CG_4_10_14_3_um_filter_53_41]|nr:MAG: TIGR01210 family radical SAM protein [Nitrospirae bacterium CG2_30_53_67]PIV84039.1 MAG: TIGR01210 family radical SAM protein [Nitrospirae bacterium CG17_big_fil_post_rev_8_21_14_2_50_50_9]PIW84787.1 MAG: TIGR01210 family radical SAM protein [Nitrospirae bacterium CG_4_8_14_3_um_filter_50_41]PIX85662.1 MAG: TIGR01210 family radical SAM protein [Nitrospirae bacterium CG_4_10_14_3_um_filter_53_41]
MPLQNTTFKPDTIRYKDVHAELKSVLTEIRSHDQKVLFEPGRALSSDIRIGYLQGRTVQRLVITLRSPGCAWVRKGGGCTMCGHYPGTTQGTALSPQDFSAQFRREAARYRGRDLPILCLYNSGSVLNEEEIPEEALAGIFEEIERMKEVRKVVLESRPEYCSEEKIAWIRKRIGGKDLEIAMGLESCNDRVLSLTLNKGFVSEDFRRMAERIRQYVAIRIYVLLKGPFLTESEAIEDAVSSIEFARTLSPSEIHLEPATLQKHTLLHSLHQAGLYDLPWLWSIYEVLSRVGAENRVYVSPFNHMPRPVHIPENCPDCSEQVRDLLTRRYNETFDLQPVRQFPCACRERWEHALKEEDPRPLAQRILEGLRVIRQAGGLHRMEAGS